MVLVDTSAWIDHLIKSDKFLQLLLLDGEVASHPLVIGVLVCGNFKKRKEIISLLQALPILPEIDLDEYLYFVEEHNQYGQGIGHIDIHLLASVKLSQLELRTRDKRLKSIAVDFKINYKN